METLIKGEGDFTEDLRIILSFVGKLNFVQLQRDEEDTQMVAEEQIMSKGKEEGREDKEKGEKGGERE